MTPDVNVLVAAAREDHPHHSIALNWLSEASTRSSPQTGLRLMGMVASGFLRVMTHPKAFAKPASAAVAVAYLDSLLARPGGSFLVSQGEWPTLKALCLDLGLAGNAVPDAWIAACVIQHHETLVTFDRDFKRLLPPQNLFMLRT